MEALIVAALVLVLTLAVVGWLWVPPLRLRLRRARVRQQPFPPAWRRVLRQHMPAFARLPAPLQLQVKKHIQVFVAEKPFIGCAGLAVTDEMRVLVAAQAALLLLNRNAGCFDRLRQVLLYPGAFVVDSVQGDAAGLVNASRQVRLGESWQHGCVVLSWADVLAGAADPADGHNVVLHEFAHQLDQENGPADGAPFLGGRDRRLRWAATLAASFALLQQAVAHEEPTLLGAYAAVSPAEFFAVATEVFFERPQALSEAEPALYAALAGCYAVDPRLRA